MLSIGLDVLVSNPHITLKEKVLAGKVVGGALPFTLNDDRTNLVLIQQRKPQSDELKLGISLPEQLMAWRRIVVASEISSDLRHQSHRVTQQRGRCQAFFCVGAQRSSFDV